jgi:hypothetical protein
MFEWFSGIRCDNVDLKFVPLKLQRLEPDSGLKLISAFAYLELNTVAAILKLNKGSTSRKKNVQYRELNRGIRISSSCPFG